MSTPALPTELWLRVFELAAQWDPAFIDIDFLREDHRNTDLLSFARVCCQWRHAAQQVLFREILLGAWAGEDHEGRVISRTDLALESLAVTLEFFHSGKNLAPKVQVLHVSIGLNERTRDERYLNPTFDQVARVVELCPRLHHLSIRVHGDPSGYSPVMSPYALRLFERATHITQLTFMDQQNESVMYHHRAVSAVRAAQGGPFHVAEIMPDLRALLWLLSALKELRYLRLSARSSHLNGTTVPKPFNHLNLQTIVANVYSTEAQLLSSIIRAATDLRSAILLTPTQTDIESLTPSLQRLVLRGNYGDVRDLSRLGSLQHLGLQPLLEGGDESISAPFLGQLPISLVSATVYYNDRTGGLSNPSDLESLLAQLAITLDIRLRARRSLGVSTALQPTCLSVVLPAGVEHVFSQVVRLCQESGIHFVCTNLTTVSFGRCLVNQLT